METALSAAPGECKAQTQMAYLGRIILTTFQH